MFLRQSTAQDIRFGPCLDIGDGVTEETALTLAQADMRLSKDGGAFAQKNTTGNATHDSDGWYSTTLDTTDTNTVGELILNVHQPANMLPVFVRWYVVEEAVYDNMYAASAVGPLTASAVNAEVDDVLSTDTQALPGQEAPSNTPTVMEMLGWLYKVLRNKKTQTTSQWSLLANDESTVDAKATVSNVGGVFSKTEIVSGP